MLHSYVPLTHLTYSTPLFKPKTGLTKTLVWFGCMATALHQPSCPDLTLCANQSNALTHLDNFSSRKAIDRTSVPVQDLVTDAAPAFSLKALRRSRWYIY